jgi:hypothetical protein
MMHFPCSPFYPLHSSVFEVRALKRGTYFLQLISADYLHQN